MHALLLVLRGLRHRRGPSLAVLLVAVVATAAAVLGPLYARSAEESLVRDRLALAPATSTGLTVSAALAGQTDQPVARLLSTVQEAADKPAYDGWYRPASVRVQVPDARITGPGGYLAVATIGWHRDQCAAVTVVQGRCPDGPHEVMVTSRMAEDGHLRVGDRLGLGLGAPDPAGNTATIVGTYDVGTADLEVWGPQSPAQAAPAGGAGDGPDHADEVVVDRASVLAATSELRVTGFRALRAERVHLVDLPAAEAVVPPNAGRLLAGQGLPTFSVLAPLGSFVQGLAPERALVRDSAFAVTAQLVLLAWFVLFLVVAAATEERAGEVALAKLRGMGPWATASFGLSEVVALLVLALPLGAVLSWGAARLLAGAMLTVGTHVEPFRLPVLAALVVALLGGLVASALAARRILSAPVLEQLRRTGGRRGGVVRSAAVDAVAVALAAAALWNLRRGDPATADGSSGTGSDALALLAPGLVALACGLLAVRLLPLVLRAQVGRTRATSRVAAFLAARNAVRRPGGLRLVVLLTVAVALVVFAVDGWTVAGHNRDATARSTVGADRVLHVVAGSPTELVAAVRAADPTGRLAMAAVEATSDSSGGLLAVDSERLAAVTAWDPAWAGTTGPALAAALRPAPPAPPQPVRFRLTADVDARWVGAPPAAPVSLFAELTDARGRPLDVPLGEVAPGRHRLDVELPQCGQAACTLEALRAVRPFRQGLSTTQGTLSVTLADAGGPLSAADGSWRVRRSSYQVAAGAAVPGTSAVTDGAVVLAFVQGGEDTVVVERADHPADLPVASGTGTVLRTYAGDPARAYGRTLDGSDAVVHPVGVRGTLPRVGRAGLLTDLGNAAALAGTGGPPVDDQVWLAPGASPDLVQRLTAQGLQVLSTESLADTRAALERDGTALALRLYLVAALLAVLLAGGAVLTSSYVAARRRSYELAALRMLGAPKRTLVAAGVREQLALVGAGVLLGLATGLAAAAVTLPALPAVAGSSVLGPPPTFATAWLPVLVVVAVLLAVVGLLAHLAARRTVRLAVVDRLREAQA
ncbi:MAG TPA: FtsX-like permease family protein [Motilibacteraceae bacterium]|nr:FtsX-like permease family protein [Motilibacteraceae bacterium]